METLRKKHNTLRRSTKRKFSKGVEQHNEKNQKLGYLFTDQSMANLINGASHNLSSSLAKINEPTPG